LKYFFYLIAIVLLLGLNIGFFPYFKIFGAVPNLLLVMVVIAGLDKESFDCFYIAFLGGLFLDFQTTAPFGSFTASFLVIAGALQLIVNNFLVFEITWKYAIAFLAGATVLSYAIFWGISHLAAHLGFIGISLNSPALKARLLQEIIYNTILLLPIYKLMDLIKYFLKLLQKRRHMA